MMTTKITILETEEDLKNFMSQTSDATIKNKLQAIYWLKTGKVLTVTQIADLLNCHRVTVQRWLNTYKNQGIKGIIIKKKSSGRPRKIAPEIVRKLENELQDCEGFSSYQEVQKWLKVFYDLNVKYPTVYKLLRYKLKAKLKVPRPRSLKQEKAPEEFKKNSNLSSSQNCH
jgi:putative transposase